MTNYLQSATITQRLFTVRGHNEALSQIHLETMETIRDEFWPFHFMLEGYQRYNFKKRTAKYQRMKARLVHKLDPNVLSGDLRRAVLTGSIIRHNSKRGSLQAKAPLSSRMMSCKNGGKQVIHRILSDERRQEIEVVNDAEKSQLTARAGERYVQMAADPAFADKVLKRV